MMTVVKNIIKLIKYGWKSGPFIIIAVLVFNILLGLSPVVELWITEQLINKFNSIVENNIIAIFP